MLKKAISWLNPCANPECKSPRLRARVQYSGAHLGRDRFCSPECLNWGLARHLGEILHRPKKSQIRRRHRIPLGLELISRGEIDTEILRNALQAQKANPQQRLGQILIGMGAVSEEQVTSAVAAQWAVPVFRLSPDRLPTAANLVPFFLMQQYKMLPVHFAESGNKLHVAFAETVDHSILYSIEQMLGVTTTACIADESILLRLVGMASQQGRTSEYFLKSNSEAELVSMVAGYSMRLHAEQISAASCHECIWVRASSRDKPPTHFLFPLAPLRDALTNETGY
jgi:hypothetical protein